MLFSGIPFLYYFLPVTLILLAISPKWAKNAMLVFCSLVFYGWSMPSYVLLMLTAVAAGYVGAVLIQWFRARKNTNGARVVLVLTLSALIGMLAWFKYADFAIENINALGAELPLVHVALPIGISFYTFQVIGYVVDVWRADVPAQKNPIDLAAFVSMFPQLIAGPIVRYTDVREALCSRSVTASDVWQGTRRFIAGLCKKILLANSMAAVCDAFRTAQAPSVLFSWLYAIAFMLFIYFDFSGYSDMAIGLGRLLGFHFPENFNYPYLSQSLTEFWRRWHMTLGGWFRDYVYIPLGGNRVTTWKWVRNLLVVWALTGLWHGAAWNFVCWGLFFAAMLLGEKKLWGVYLKRHPVFSHVYALLFVLLSFVLFNASSLSGAAADFAGLFGLSGAPLVCRQGLYYLRSNALLFVICIIGTTPVVSRVRKCMDTLPHAAVICTVLESVLCVAGLLLCTAYLVDGSFNPFLYFRF